EPENTRFEKPARDHRPRDAGKPRRDHDAPRPERAPRGKFDRGNGERGAPMGVQANGPWFLLNVGRERNADPKWLLPEICRQGDVTKQDIGAIRVYDTETRFQVDARVAEKFASLVAGRQKGGVRIFPAPGNHGDPSPPRGDRQAAAAPAETDASKPFVKKPFDKKPFGDKK